MLSSFPRFFILIPNLRASLVIPKPVYHPCSPCVGSERGSGVHHGAAGGQSSHPGSEAHARAHRGDTDLTRCREHQESGGGVPHPWYWPTPETTNFENFYSMIFWGVSRFFFGPKTHAQALWEKEPLPSNPQFEKKERWPSGK